MWRRRSTAVDADADTFESGSDYVRQYAFSDTNKNDITSEDDAVVTYDVTGTQADDLWAEKNVDAESTYAVAAAKALRDQAVRDAGAAKTDAYWYINTPNTSPALEIRQHTINNAISELTYINDLNTAKLTRVQSLGTAEVNWSSAWGTAEVTETASLNTADAADATGINTAESGWASGESGRVVSLVTGLDGASVSLTQATGTAIVGYQNGLGGTMDSLVSSGAEAAGDYARDYFKTTHAAV